MQACCKMTNKFTLQITVREYLKETVWTKKILSKHFCTDSLLQFAIAFTSKRLEPPPLFFCFPAEWKVFFVKHTKKKSRLCTAFWKITTLLYRFLTTLLCFLIVEDKVYLFFLGSHSCRLKSYLGVFSLILSSPPGQPVSSLDIETMDNSSIKDEAVHQRAPENPVHKISSSKSICNLFQKSITVI